VHRSAGQERQPVQPAGAGGTRTQAAGQRGAEQRGGGQGRAGERTAGDRGHARRPPPRPDRAASLVTDPVNMASEPAETSWPAAR
jgi:hypothetical protein